MRRIFSVRAAAAERITTGAESRNSARVMFPNAEDVQTDLIGELNLFQ
jgi:hypothetical protein